MRLRARRQRLLFSSVMIGLTPAKKSSTTLRAYGHAGHPVNVRDRMASRLLEQQTSLLEYLTSGRVIFGATDIDPAKRILPGVPTGVLRLEARMSHAKRMAKITAVFDKTFELLGNGKQTIL